MSHIRVLTEDAIRILVIDRPEKRNAFAGTMREDLRDAIVQAGRDETLRALIIAGAGPAFCAGADLGAIADAIESGAGFAPIERNLAIASEALRALQALPFPSIAAVQGAAAGAGFSLALACDLRIAAHDAAFTASWAKIGLHPDWAMSYNLARCVGAARALEICTTARTIDAEEALRIGLVQEIADDAQLRARSLAAQIAAHPRASVASILQTFRADPGLLQSALDRERAEQERCFLLPETQARISRFAKRR